MGNGAKFVGLVGDGAAGPEHGAVGTDQLEFHFVIGGVGRVLFFLAADKERPLGFADGVFQRAALIIEQIR